MASEKFPEAFRRFEQVVDVDRIESWNELKSEFQSWAGWNWKDTWRQRSALADEARRLKIPVEGEGAIAWRGRVSVAEREWTERKFSVSYVSFSVWQEKSMRTSAYQHRIESYMLSHPHATLAEARGHSRR